MAIEPKAKRGLDLQAHSELVPQPDGTYVLRLPWLGLSVSGPTPEDAWRSLTATLVTELETSPEARKRFGAFVEEHAEELRPADVVNLIAHEAQQAIPALTDETFDDAIHDPGPLLVDFWAPWCTSCIDFAPVIERLGEEHEGELRIAAVDIDAHEALAAAYNIRSLPTLLLFDRGVEVLRLIGTRSLDQLHAELDPHLR